MRAIKNHNQADQTKATALQCRLRPLASVFASAHVHALMYSSSHMHQSTKSDLSHFERDIGKETKSIKMETETRV